MLFKNSVRTSKRTLHFTITKINWLTLFKFNRRLLGLLQERPISPLRLLGTHRKTSFTMSRVSSISILSAYGLDDQAIEVRSLAGAKDFSCNLCVQTGPGAHPASCTMGTGGSFPGAKARPGRDADHSPLSSAEVENE
jgi:hypothetical protein